MQLKNLLPLALATTAVSQMNSTGNMTLTNALMSQNSSLSVLNGLLLQNPSLVAALNNASNITILAPSNDALNAVLNNTNASMALARPGYLQALLTYHVLNGTYYGSNFTNMSMFIPTMLTNMTYANVTGGQRVQAVMSNGNVTFFSALKQNVSVTTPNVNFTGGTIHIINGLLSIPQNDTTTLPQANLTAAAGAIQAAGLGPALNSMRDVTIFAPNNDAFGAISSLSPNITNSTLMDILGYHVITGAVDYSTLLTGNTTITASNGKPLNLTVANGNVYVNAAQVTIPDLLVSNGVVHVINQVLNPNATMQMPNTTGTAMPSPAFSGASSGTAGIPFTSGIMAPTSTAPAATSGGANPGRSSSSSAAGNHLPVQTGAVGAAALFGVAGAFMAL